MAAPRGFLSCHRSVVHAAPCFAHARERQSSPDYDLRNCPSWSWIDDLTAQRTTGVRIRVGMSTDEKRPERCDLNARRAQPKCAWNTDRTQSGALNTRQMTCLGDLRTGCRTVLDEHSAWRTAVNYKGRAAIFGLPMTAASRGSCQTGECGEWMNFFADKRIGISAPEQRWATMRAAKPRSHPPLFSPTEVGPQSVSCIARHDFLRSFRDTNITAPPSSVVSVDTA
jgi:hypothetical protein